MQDSGRRVQAVSQAPIGARAASCEPLERRAYLGGCRWGSSTATASNVAVEVTDETEPSKLAADLEQLGPTFVKLGQLLSTRSDLLPPAYLEALTRFQDDVSIS